MEATGLLHRLGVALAIGLLVGAERHWRMRDEESGKRTAGVRTFGLTGLLGGVTGALAGGLGGLGAGLLLGLVFLGQGAAMALFKLREAEAEGRFGVTSVVAAQATFLLGAFAVLGEATVAGAAAVAMTALLAARESLHGFMARLSWVELRSAVVLLAMTLVALPLVPDRPLEVLGGLNPARVWLLAVILAAVSFLGYVAMRLFGTGAGQAAAGAAAGLVSSTAATLANARASAARPSEAAPLAAGALIAGAVSCLRTAALAWIGSAAVGAQLAPALLAAAAVQAAGAGLLLARRAPGAAAGEGQAVDNPFELGAVLQLAGLLAAVGLVADLASHHFGGAGAFVVAAISGLADVDAVTLTIPGLVPERLSPWLAAATVAVAVGSNALAKCAYAAVLGGRGYAWRFGAGTLAGLFAAALVLGLYAGD
ncbi:MgtC/SapB family protein [Roseicella aerolata]|uniref:DUF4010 domain-containing protein n=1 Tax=Roseicella aerolata TaxID=2883479 RepID=A0A9X1LD04_9PROT|nr:DUF4010 domain-containing protein [Roseicella aerolata]MCB4824740.1 DUF4010 domain-containing protein [Roseicella aerolata]